MLISNVHQQNKLDNQYLKLKEKIALLTSKKQNLVNKVVVKFKEKLSSHQKKKSQNIELSILAYKARLSEAIDNLVDIEKEIES